MALDTSGEAVASPSSSPNILERNMNWIISFLKDERGLEAVEFLTAAVPVTGGAAVAFVALKDDLTTKSGTLIDAISVEP